MSQLEPDMSTPSSDAQAEIHESLKRHKKEAWWQVTLPVLLVVLLSITAVVLTYVLGKEQGASIVADYSLILLIILGLMGGLITLVPIVALIYGITLLIQKTPPYTSQAQSFMQQVYEWVDETTDRIAQIVIVARSALAGVNHYLRSQGIIPETESSDNPDKSAATGS